MKKAINVAEIEVLTKLWDLDGYFKDEFHPKDIDQMISNIKNDHPLLLDTTVGKAINVYAGMKVKQREDFKGIAEARLSHIKAMERDLKGWVVHEQAILANLMYCEGKKGEELATTFFGDDVVLKHKVKNRMPLSDKQIKSLAAKID